MPGMFTAPHTSLQNEAITCGDYLLWRFAKAFSYRSETLAGRSMNRA